MSTDITMTITELSVSVLPDDHPDYETYRVAVRWHGPDSYGVHRGAACLSRSGRWEREPIPSSRTKTWVAAHRWTYVKARHKACEVAPTITINGRLVLDLLAAPPTTQEPTAKDETP